MQTSRFGASKSPSTDTDYSAATLYKSLVDICFTLACLPIDTRSKRLKPGPAVADGHQPLLEKEVPQRQVPDHESLQLKV